MSDGSQLIPGPDPGACPDCGAWRKAGLSHDCAEEQALEVIRARFLLWLSRRQLERNVRGSVLHDEAGDDE